jgi:hypothetical protein
MDALLTYLEDHRSGAVGAVELLEALERRADGSDVGRFASDILRMVRADVQVLDRLIEAVGDRSRLKEAAAWVGQKVAHLKMPGHGGHDLCVFESLEALALGILGKRALWQALAQTAVHDPRLGGVDYDVLILRAEEQFGLVNARRLDMAAGVLARRTEEQALVP